MIKQIIEIAKVVVISSLRKNIIYASILIMLPLLLAAWLFEVSNPGFQTGFIVDAGGGLMAMLSIIILGTLSFEHLFWPSEQQTPWFYFSRIKSRIIFPLGKFLGISFVSGLILAAFAFLLSLLIYFTYGSFLLSSLKIAFVIWAEYNVYLSLFVLLSTYFSKLMSVGMMLPIVFIANSIQYIKSLISNNLLSTVLIIFPDISIFYEATESKIITPTIIAFAYSLFMVAFYMTVTALVLKRKDL